MRVAGPVIGSADPLRLAEFYATLLDWPLTDREHAGVEGAAQDWARIRCPSGGQKLEFRYEPYFTPPTWPPVEGEQQMLMHLDIAVEDLDAGVAWAIGAGATVAEFQPQEGIRVMLDPAGNPFCLFPDHA
ncbi:MAG: VOC family protein [Actinobacteria bacterium]|nr:VOC family protein [Actinomycetota bacterium]MBI3688494.1 VOC family protein [Actinomycetota bacterium]